VLERFEHDFEKAKRILAPNLDDWTQTGSVPARLAVKDHSDQIGKGRLTNDAFSAGRSGITVITRISGSHGSFQIPKLLMAIPASPWQPVSI
jgi:hypothetical protein